ncbi:MAG: alpha/beta hydrolase [Acetobacteraceae bacterium]|nr:alpha/beta hydrolase [Acetobacteraceae bacterium]
MARTAATEARRRQAVGAEGGADLTVFFATNRNPVGDPVRPDGFGTALNGDGAELRFGQATFAGAASGQFRAQATRSFRSRNRSPRIARSGELGSTVLFDRLRALLLSESGPARDLLLYVHGFETTFDDALALTAQIAGNLTAVREGFAETERPPPVVPLVFTWPSDGERSPRAYWSDVDDAERSGHALRRTLQFVSGFLAGLAEAAARPRLVLAVQSLGHAVLAAALASDDFPAGIDVLLSTGADIEADAFEPHGRFRRLPELVPRTVVYHCVRDGALQLSQTVRAAWNGLPSGRLRLGQIGPRHDLPVVTVEAVDVDAVVVGTGDDLFHFYGRLNRTVQADMLRVLAGLPSHAIPGRQQIGPRRYALTHG